MHPLEPSGLLFLQVNEEVPPPPPPPSLPVVSTSFDVIQLSVEISDRLEVFSRWSRRVLRYLQRRYGCPKH